MLDAPQGLAHLGDRGVEPVVLPGVVVTTSTQTDIDHVGDPPRARRHHDDPVGQVHRLGDRVRDEHDRRVGRRTDLQQFGLHVLTSHLVERTERFVHQQQRRVCRERPSDRDPLLHTPRELPRHVTGEFREFDEFEHFVRAGPTPGLVPALQLERQLDVLLDGAPVEQARLLERHAVVLVEAGLRSRLAVHDDAAVGRLDEVGDQAEQRRLPAPRRADQRHELARLDGELDAGQRVDLVRGARVEDLRHAGR